MPLLGFILLMGMAVQNQPAPATQSEKAKLFLQAQTRQSAGSQALDQAQALGQRPFDRGVCYAIRSYIFARQDGNAPVLVSTSTCTPASTVRPRKVANPTQVGLVPL